jgi:hypothetical protein
MIEINEMRTPLTPEQGLAVLQRETDAFGCFIDLDRVLEHISLHSLLISKLLAEYRRFLGDPCAAPPTPGEKLALLTQRFGVPEYKLTNRHTGRPSASSDLLESLRDDASSSEDVRHIVSMFLSFSEHATARGHLEQFRTLPLCKLETSDGHRMVRAAPKWTLLNTNRFSSSGPNLQGVAHEHADIYAAPKGYAVIFSDSGQIEPRILYSAYVKDPLIKWLIELYDDAYYGLLHFIRLSPGEETSLRAGTAELAPYEITPEIKEQRQTLKTLGLAGNYGSSNLGAIHPVLGPLYARKVVNHPLRKEWENAVREQVSRGTETFYTAFGNAITPGDTEKHKRGTPGWINHLIRCGINNPIQGTAADLMLWSLSEAAKVLGLRGHIGYYKHDEGCFYVPEDKCGEYAPLLRECLAYQVRDWIPIRSDLTIGGKKVSSEHASRLF